jgi:hypothetical protein
VNNDAGPILDDILVRWHTWRQGYKPERGFNGKSLVAGDYVTSRQYDDQNGALDDAIEANRMGSVDFQICEIGVHNRQHYYAICANARALKVGCAVFSHVMLPSDPQERGVVMRYARVELTRRLLSAGVI